MSATSPTWGTEIAVENVGGIPFRMYSQRPHRVEELIGLARNWGARPQVIQGDSILTFEDLYHAVAAKADELAGLGIKRGDRVFMLAWSSAEFIVNFWACICAGAVPVLANAWWSETEIANGLQALQPVMVLADQRTAGKVSSSWRLGPWEMDTTHRPDSNALRHASGSQDEQEIAVIVFTSGTSGLPKAVMLSHRAALAGLQMMLHITRQLPLQFNEAKAEVALHTGPLFHVGGPQVMLRSIAVGNTLVFTSGRFDPEEVLRLIERHKVTRWTAVPTMITRVLDHPDVHTRDLRSLRSVGTGGTPVGGALLERIRTGLPDAKVSIAIGYGLTENTGPATTASGADTLNHPGTCGRPLPCVEIMLAPKPGLPDAEVLVRSPTQMSGYYGMDDSPIDQDGWLNTGDLGRMDETGLLWITGRSKDMIIRGGENIAPVAIERALEALPGVAEAAVFGVPHPDLGEEVMAVVVVRNELDELNEQQLQQQLRGTLASFAIPSRWRIQKEPLLTNMTGKIDKSAMAAQARAELAAEGAAKA